MGVSNLSVISKIQVFQQAEELFAMTERLTNGRE